LQEHLANITTTLALYNESDKIYIIIIMIIIILFAP